MAVKFEILQCFVTKKIINVLRFMESNMCWDILPKMQRPAGQTWGWWETCQWIVLHNQMEEN